MTNKTYDILKWVALAALPALAVFVGVVFPLWEIPNSEKIAATIAAINALLGALIGLNSVSYNKARHRVEESE